MKRLLVLIVLGFVVTIIFSFVASDYPGYVRIYVGNWLVDIKLWVALALNIFILVTAMIAVSLLRRVFQSKKLWSWFGQSGSKRAQQKTERGLIALLEGNWSSANKLLSRSASKSDAPLINYLAAAHAAHELGDIKEAELHLKKAYEDTSDSEFAVGIAQAQIQLQQNQLEQCLATLLRLKKQQENHPLVLKLLKNVYLRLEDWQQLLNLIPALKKITKTSGNSLEKPESLAWQKLFVQKTDELRHQRNLDSSAEILAALWKKMPDTLRFEPSLIETYAKQLIRLNNEGECEILLRKILSQHWDDNLIALYGVVNGKNTSEQLINAENWLKQKPNNANLLLALGRLSLRNELWGKALEYFEASNRLQPNKQSYAELCRLSMNMNKNDQALFSGLIDSLALPDLPLPK